MSKYSENTPSSLKDAIGWMFDYIEPNKIFLDFGCSTGYFGELIKKAKNNKVYGIEISDDIKTARQVLDGVYSFDIDGKWPEKVYDRKYDYVFFGDVLEHLKDPAEALRKCLPLLKKEGKVFVSTPNVAHISVRLELMSGNFEYEPMGILDNTHLKYFTLNSLSEIARNAGYEIEKIDHSLNDYPKETIEKLLTKSGLQPNDKFWKLTEAIEARAYQYKLILNPSKNAKRPAASKKNPSSKPAIVKPNQVRDAYVDDLKTQIYNLRKHAKKQAEIMASNVDTINNLKTSLEHAQHQLDRIRNSVPYRALRVAKHIRKPKY